MLNVKWPTKVRRIGGDRTVYRMCPYCKTEFCDDKCLAAALDDVARLAAKAEKEEAEAWGLAIEVKRLHKMLAKLEAQLKKEMRQNDRVRLATKGAAKKALKGADPGSDFVARWTKVIESL
jgi:hypothetical protein